MTATRVRHKLNVVGPFYVENGCCMTCAVPELTAPELFGSWQTADEWTARGPSLATPW